jgi:hypothetical protein
MSAQSADIDVKAPYGTIVIAGMVGVGGIFIPNEGGQWFEAARDLADTERKPLAPNSTCAPKNLRDA